MTKTEQGDVEVADAAPASAAPDLAAVICPGLQIKTDI